MTVEEGEAARAREGQELDTHEMFNTNVMEEFIDCGGLVALWRVGDQDEMSPVAAVLPWFERLTAIRCERFRQENGYYME